MREVGTREREGKARERRNEGGREGERGETGEMRKGVRKQERKDKGEGKKRGDYFLRCVLACTLVFALLRCHFLFFITFLLLHSALLIITEYFQ